LEQIQQFVNPVKEFVFVQEIGYFWNKSKICGFTRIKLAFVQEMG
jgi:hypothetical protein